MAGRRPWRQISTFGTLQFLQCNLGHARRAQDLLCQTIRESRIALAVVAEPYRVPGTPKWEQDTSGRSSCRFEWFSDDKCVRAL
jgi:hypothetical protein